MPKLTIPGPPEGQMSVEQFAEQHIEKQKEREPEQSHVQQLQRAPQEISLKLDNPENIELYREAVKEAVGFYRNERVTGHKNAVDNAELAQVPLDQDGRQRIQKEANLGERRDQLIDGAEKQLETVLKAMNPKTGDRLRPLVEGHLEQLMELSNVGHTPMRPGLERIENQGVLQKSIAPVNRLERDRDGGYQLVGPDGQPHLANGSFAFAITVSNPTEIRVGSRSDGGHMALTRGGDVYFAGEVHFENGKLTSWDNGSGHYMPTVDQKRQVGETAISSLETLLPRDRFQPHKM